jgi:hypothetical protein
VADEHGLHVGAEGGQPAFGFLHPVGTPPRFWTILNSRLREKYRNSLILFGSPKTVAREAE